MSYTVAALCGVAAALLADLLVLGTRLVTRPVFWATYPIIIFFQLVSNGILTGRDVVRYDPDVIVGLRVVNAPVEDLLFGFAMVLLTLSIWVWLGRREVRRTPRREVRRTPRREVRRTPRREVRRTPRPGVGSPLSRLLGRVRRSGG